MTRLGYFLLLSILVQIVCAEFQLTERPVNTAGHYGSTTRLNCSVDSFAGVHNLEWAVQKMGLGQTPSTLFNCDVRKCSSPADTDKNIYSTDDQMKSDLIITGMNWETAALYICDIHPKDTHGDHEMTKVDLVTVEGPSCPESGQSKDKGDMPNLDCSLKYVGNIEPTLVWYIDGTEVDGAFVVPQPEPEEGQPEPGPNDPKTITYRYNFTVQHTDHNKMFECRVKFTKGNTERPAEFPTYTESCTTYFTVQYGVTNVKISPDPDNFSYGIIKTKVGDVINCTASANPPATYFWKRVEGTGTQELINQDQILITRDMIGRNRYNCTASNTLDGQIYYAHREAKFDVDGTTGGKNGFSPNTGVIVVLSLYLFVTTSIIRWI